MKKTIIAFITAITLLSSSVTAFASVGDMGFFGGINEGTRLPKTTETIINSTSTKKKSMATESPYKEVMFISGVPTVFEGILTIKQTGEVAADKDVGTYKVTYEVRPNAVVEEGASTINRIITFNVNYRKENNQIVKDYHTLAWTETLSAGEQTYVLDKKQSHYDVSTLEDITAAVVYYKGDISQKAVYVAEAGEGGGETENVKYTTIETTGSLYGYNSAWSNTETHRIDARVYTDEWQMEYQVRPSVSTNKTLQYSKNEPSAISFSGNYRENMSNKSGLQYDIFTQPVMFYDVPKTGGTSIGTYNSFEQLIAPDTNYLKGNAAEADISKLFAMGILDGQAKQFVPSQAVTRAQFTTMVAKAIKLPIEQPEKTTTISKKVQPVTFVFPDVLNNRPDYPYIMAAYKSGLATGRGDGYFYADYSLQREEAVSILLRSLGLSNLGLDPTPITPFADDASVSAWAKKDLYAAYKIGLIQPDENGNINPKTIVSKAESAALVNRLIEYMRTDLQTDYSELIVNFAN